MAISEKIQKRINRLTGGASLPAAMSGGAGALMDLQANMTAPRSSKALNPDSEKISDLSAPIVENLASSDMAKFVTELQNQMPSFGRGGYQLPPSRRMARVDGMKERKGFPIDSKESQLKMANQEQAMEKFQALQDMKGQMSSKDMQMLMQQMEKFQALQDMKGQMSSKDMQMLMQQMENAQLKASAPLSPLAEELAMQGDGEDTQLAHLRPGEIVLPPEFMEDAQFEASVERKFKEFEIDPEKAIVGGGIASLNPKTGLQEFGFFKKLGKKLKKVVKKVAPIAMFVPGVGTALGGVLGGIGGLATKIPGIGGALGKVGGVLGKGLSGIASLGIPGLSSIAGGAASGGFGNIMSGLTNPLAGGMFGATGSTFAGGPAAGKGFANMLGLGSGTPAQVAAQQQAQQAQQQAQAALNAMTPQQMAANPAAVAHFQAVAAGGGAATGASGSPFSNMFGGGGGGGGGSGGGGGMSPLAMLGIGGLAAGLGKLAYEDAKEQTGVPLTPLTTMSPTGRYNIEAEIARRMGESAPNPVEFGLLPEGTIPQLSGGMPAGMMYGGPVMAYAEGGAVQMQEGGEMNPSQFPRMDGDINGPGTETSDDIPAMLSDGEFVMTGRAVRGAGSYNMEQGDGGIINLVPSYDESRERGMDLMYQMMDVFANNAEAS
jgi:hypothetical protein